MTDTKKYGLLLVDDEVEILNALRRVFRRQFTVHICDNGQDALALLRQEDIAVIISDMRMPHMDGAAFLTAAKELKPQTIRLLLTGYADIESTARAINDAEIFSYVSKPWNNTDLQLVVNRAVERYELDDKIHALNSELALKNEQLTIVNQGLEEKVQQRTKALQNSNTSLSSSLNKQRSMFQGVLEMINMLIAQRIGIHQGHNKRVATHCRLLAEWMGLERQECTHLYLAAIMYDVGKVSLPDELITVNELTMSPAQSAAYQVYVTNGADVVESIPSLAASVGPIIRYQNAWFSGGGFPGDLEGEQIPLGSRILKVVKDYDNLLLGELSDTPLLPKQAETHLRENEFGKYDPNVVGEFLKLLNDLTTKRPDDVELGVTSELLRAGMMLAQNVQLDEKNVLLPKDSELTTASIEKIKSLESNRDQRLTIFVR